MCIMRNNKKVEKHGSNSHVMQQRDTYLEVEVFGVQYSI